METPKKLLNVSTHFIPFNNISDLLRKVDKLKEAHKLKSEIFRQMLKEKGIKFTPINNYGVAIDISLLSKKDILFIKTQDNSLIEKIYKQIGIIQEPNISVSLPTDECIEDWWAGEMHGEEFWQEVPFRTNGDVIEEIKTAIKHFIKK